MRVNMNKTEVVISEECQKLMQKAARWPYSVCSRGVGSNSIQCTVIVVRSAHTRSVEV